MNINVMQMNTFHIFINSITMYIFEILILGNTIERVRQIYFYVI